MISETITDNSFPISQFTMTSYSIPFRLDRTSRDGGILLFVKEDIHCKTIKTGCDANFEVFFVEINLKEKKWLLCCSYNPHKSNRANHLKSSCKTLEKLNTTYDNLILLGDLNVEPEEYCQVFKPLQFERSKKNPCFKNSDKPTCIDLILTYCPGSS